jgi:hypothetical protein
MPALSAVNFTFDVFSPGTTSFTPNAAISNPCSGASFTSWSITVSPFLAVIDVGSQIFTSCGVTTLTMRSEISPACAGARPSTTMTRAIESTLIA